MATRKSGLEWKAVGHKSLFSTRIFDIHEIQSISPENEPGVFYTLHAANWVIVIPVIKDPSGNSSFVMVHQWRHGAGTMSLEFPGGVINSNEKPELAAERELWEETGYRPQKLELAGILSPNPAIMDNQCYVFIAEKLENTYTMNPDDDEYLAVEILPDITVINEMGKCLFIHGLMSAALFLYVQKKGLPAKM